MDEDVKKVTLFANFKDHFILLKPFVLQSAHDFVEVRLLDFKFFKTGSSREELH